MARVYAASDTTEPVADTDAEQFGNVHLYGVISGCAVTFDASDMTYDVAAGTILHNGSVVSVAAQANAGTLVADGSNPRWATIYLDSSGTEGLVSGTAAADPSKPETGDNVELGMVLIEAGQTVANNIATKLDKRVWTHPQNPVGYKYKTASQNFTSTTYADVTATSGNLAFTAAASTAYWVEWVLSITTAVVGGWKFQLTGPSSPTAVHITIDYPTSDGTAYPIRGSLTQAVTAFSTNIISVAGGAGAGAGYQGMYRIHALIVNGANSGAVTLQAAQNTASGTSTIFDARMTVLRSEAAV